MIAIREVATLPSPSLLVFREETEANLTRMIGIAGDASRLRPHCKTHKMPALIQRWLDLGVTKHKCATLAEAEMVAAAGAPDVLWAYPAVGANIRRVVEFRRKFPQTRFCLLIDHEQPLVQLEDALASANVDVDALMDVETGLQRTGVPPGPEAVSLYQKIASSPHITAVGLHWYDGHLHQRDLDERRAAVLGEWKQCLLLREQLEAAGLPVPTVVAGGTGSFPIYASLDDPAIELSPGSCVFHDAGYGSMFPDLPFTPSVRLLTRVISRPSHRRVTFDLGYKAVASDPPLEHRVVFPDIPDATIVLQNEEHLVIETEAARRFSPGDAVLGIPWHICPTVALHEEAVVLADGKVTDHWPITARNRKLTI